MKRVIRRKNKPYKTKSNLVKIKKTPGKRFLSQTRKKIISPPKCLISKKILSGNSKKSSSVNRKYGREYHISIVKKNFINVHRNLYGLIKLDNLLEAINI